MTSACERVLNTPELLEALLLQFQPLDLLLAQLVSSNCYRAIKQSPRLQQALFLRHESNDATQDQTGWRINPLLRAHFLPWFVGPGDFAWNVSYNAIRNLDWTTNNKEAFMRAESGWRKMFILQPPPKQLVIRRYSKATGGSSIREAIVSFQDCAAGGVTMGAIYDITEKSMRSQSGQNFGLTFDDSAAGPQLTLHLEHFHSCVRRCRDPNIEYFISEDTKPEWSTDNLEWKDIFVKHGRGARLEGWERNLSPEKGGVTAPEWERWENKKGV